MTVRFTGLAALWLLVSAGTAHADNEETLARIQDMRMGVLKTNNTIGLLTRADEELSQVNDALERWRGALESLQQAHTVWIDTYARLIKDFVAQSRPVKTAADYKREEQRVQEFMEKLPALNALETRSNALLTTLTDYVPRASLACDAADALLERRPQPLADQPDLLAQLQATREAIKASVDDAGIAYALIHTQLRSRAGLYSITPELWRTRLGSAAGRLQIDEAIDMGRRLERGMHDLGIVNAYRVEIIVRQKRIDRKKGRMPLLMRREQRMMTVLLNDLAREATLHELVPEVQPHLQKLITEARESHQMSLTQLERLTVAELAASRAARLDELRHGTLARQAPVSACDALLRNVADGSDLRSEKSYEEYWQTCVAH